VWQRTAKNTKEKKKATDYTDATGGTEKNTLSLVKASERQQGRPEVFIQIHGGFSVPSDASVKSVAVLSCSLYLPRSAEMSSEIDR
jgi:hypothetical protein